MVLWGLSRTAQSFSRQFTDRRDLCLCGNLCAQYVLAYLIPLSMGCGMGALIMVGYASFTEFIPPAVRGKWSARLSFCRQLVAHAVGGHRRCSDRFFSWRMMFLLGGAAMLLAWYLSGMYFIESPRWLAGKGQRHAAEEHLRQVESQIEKEKTSHYRPGRVLPRLRSRARKAALSGCCLKVRCCGERWWRSRY